MSTTKNTQTKLVKLLEMKITFSKFLQIYQALIFNLSTFQARDHYIFPSKRHSKRSPGKQNLLFLPDFCTQKLFVFRTKPFRKVKSYFELRFIKRFLRFNHKGYKKSKIFKLKKRSNKKTRFNKNNLIWSESRKNWTSFMRSSKKGWWLHPKQRLELLSWLLYLLICLYTLPPLARPLRQRLCQCLDSFRYRSETLLRTGWNERVQAILTPF